VAEGIRPLLPVTRYSVIANWISGQKPFQSPLGHLSSPARVLCASRLEHYKGIHLLIEAARQLPQIEVTIVGEGSDRNSLEKMATGLPTVRFAGFQRNIHKFYEAADIFVMPSMGPEGLPITSLEAMGYGLPCIFSDLPVHHEITDQGKGAYLFRSGEADSLSPRRSGACDMPPKPIKSSPHATTREVCGMPISACSRGDIPMNAML
jgi:glycosyltransferase involved in cell wall biosynthesis